MKKILASFSHAFHNIRSHFFHTLLSVLGIVIGVAALVSILSLIDGMERYAKEQITKTTSLNAITINPNVFKRTNGVRIRKDTFAVLGYNDFKDLKETLTKPCSLNYMTSFTDIGQCDGKDVGAVFFALGSPFNASTIGIISGSAITQDEINDSSPKAAVNLAFIHNVDSTLKPEQITGKTIVVRNKSVTIATVIDDKSKDPHVGFPLTLLTTAYLHANPPSIVVEANNIEDVKELKDQVNSWISGRFKDISDFAVYTNETRVEQATQGFLLFRVIMGLIVGISVVVGGIGIMNVLLISITERTVEIGIRKAVGANRRDLIM